MCFRFYISASFYDFVTISRVVTVITSVITVITIVGVTKAGVGWEEGFCVGGDKFL